MRKVYNVEENCNKCVLFKNRESVPFILSGSFVGYHVFSCPVLSLGTAEIVREKALRVNPRLMRVNPRLIATSQQQTEMGLKDLMLSLP